MATLISHFGALGIVGAAAVSQFGWLRGLGVLAIFRSLHGIPETRWRLPEGIRAPADIRDEGLQR